MSGKVKYRRPTLLITTRDELSRNHSFRKVAYFLCAQSVLAGLAPLGSRFKAYFALNKLNSK